MGIFNGYFLLRNKFGKPLLKNVQSFVEDYAYCINTDLGIIVQDFNKVNNDLNDLIDNVVETADNALSAGPVHKMVDHIVKPSKQFSRGDHLYVYRLGYTHHGLYLGYNKVAEYDGKKIREIYYEEFAENRQVFKKLESESPKFYSANEIVSRARKRYGESNYNLLFNNCENFVRWCRCGD